MTTEQIAGAVARAKHILKDAWPSQTDRDVLSRALLAEHERAERLEKRVQELGDELDKRDEFIQANEKDAARWRAVREHLRIVTSDPYGEDAAAGLEVVWWLEHEPCDYPIPDNVDEAADRMIREQENSQ